MGEKPCHSEIAVSDHQGKMIGRLFRSNIDIDGYIPLTHLMGLFPNDTGSYLDCSEYVRQICNLTLVKTEDFYV